MGERAIADSYVFSSNEDTPGASIPCVSKEMFTFQTMLESL